MSQFLMDRKKRDHRDVIRSESNATLSHGLLVTQLPINTSFQLEFSLFRAYWSNGTFKGYQNTLELLLTDDWPDFAHLKISTDEPGHKEYIITSSEFVTGLY